MWQYILLGIIQGIFEWFPISSEGILAIFNQLLNIKVNPIDIALFLHLGTFLAVMIYFWRDWKEVILFRDRRLIFFMVIATVISMAIGYPLYHLIRNIAVGSTLLLITGIGLFITAIFHKKKLHLKINFNLLAVITGFLQGLSVIPGLSRSATTIFGLSLGEESPAQILKISYMMSAPVVLASGIYLYLQNPSLIANAWIALLFSFVIGILSLYLLLKLASTLKFFKFALIFGILCIMGATLGFIFKF